MVKHRIEQPAADLDGEPIPDGASEAERRHAVWGLAVLAMIAILIVTAMAFLIGPAGGHKQRIGLFFPTDSTQPSPTGQTTASPSGTPTSSARASAHTSANPSPSITHPTTRPTTASPSPSSTQPTTPHSSTPPPSGMPISVDSDLMTVINNYRQSRHLPRILSWAHSPALASCTALATAPRWHCTPDGTEGVTSRFLGYAAFQVLYQQTPGALMFTSRSITCSEGWSYHQGWSVPYYFAVVCTG